MRHSRKGRRDWQRGKVRVGSVTNTCENGVRFASPGAGCSAAVPGWLHSGLVAGAPSGHVYRTPTTRRNTRRKHSRHQGVFPPALALQARSSSSACSGLISLSLPRLK